MKKKSHAYKLTNYQKKLIDRDQINKNNSLTDYINRIIYNHILIEKGYINDRNDDLLEKDLYNNQINYILNSKLEEIEKNENIYKYNIANYYYQLAKQFNKIAKERKITRNELWKIVRNSIQFKDSNQTELRIYKLIFRGELIPSPKYVFKKLHGNDELPSYKSIIFLNRTISSELKKAYESLTNRV